MPLRALLSGKDFFAEDLTENHRKYLFICPNCPSRLIPVIPKRNRIKHFRHRDGHTHYEPETHEHMAGKKVLTEIADKIGLKAVTEYRIGEHITDVFIEGKQPLAIEFQCSKCDSSEIEARTVTYLQNGVATFWILGRKFFKDFQRKRRGKIEREIDRLHPTVYYVDNKFSVCRNNPKHHNFRIIYVGEERRLVEDFDVEWHILNFINTKINEENPTLTFKWMIPEQPRHEEPEKLIEPKPVESPNGVKEEITNRPPLQFRQKRYKSIGQKTYVQPTKREIKKEVHEIVPTGPIWYIKKINASETCDLCGKRHVEYALRAAFGIKIKRCENCLTQLKKDFTNAVWKVEE